MILKRIIVKRLKAIKEKSIEFSPGLNIIKGSDNEVGKSSLRIAIEKALYQDPTTTKEEIHRLTSWGEEPWEVELDIQDNSKNYRIIKNLKDGSCKLVDLDSSKVITNKKAITDKVVEITGCPSEVFFESTACITQDEWIRIIPQTATKGEKQSLIGTITKRLQSTLAGAKGVDVSTIISKLYEKTHRKDARGPYSDLQRIKDRIEYLKLEKGPSEDKVNRVMENRRELNSIKEELEQLNEDLPPKQDLLEKNKKILELEEEINRKINQYRNFERAKGLKSKLDEKEFSCFEGSEGKIEQLKTGKSDIDGLGRQRSEIQKEIKSFQEQGRTTLWMLISGLILTVGGLVGLLITKYLGIAAVVGLLVLGYWLISQKMRKDQIKSRSNKVTELERQIQSNEGIVRNILSGFGFRDYDRCLQKFQEYTEKKNYLSGIIGEKDWNTFEKENENLEIQVRAAQKELKNLNPFKIDPLELQKLENKVSRLENRKEELEGEKRGLDRFFQYTDADTDQLASVEEELKSSEQEKKFYEREKKIYEITQEALDEAHKQTLSKATEALEKKLGSYISVITDGRYNKVEIDEGDLSIWTLPPEKEDKVNVLELSRATRDQFYISARFALAKLITGGKKPPLLLDDPFVNFHPKRLKKIISLLQEITKENQVLLFTCSDAYDNYGNVISLD